ncbi:MAG: alpha/beta hydrolase-fold protein [Lentimicrobium sp.]|jgi:enterochelin esterase-like enzyme|nr:alpha/beta hydrolase-fold protein [Lentimicrobium sp.]
MKKTALLFFFALFLFAAAWAGNELRMRESMCMHSRILNQDVHFSVILPETYFSGNQKYPVVYMLHGLGDDETSWLEYGCVNQFADQAIRDGEIVPMIFIMPEAFRTYYVNDFEGSFLYQDMFILELVPHIDSLFRTIADKQHRALMGYSMGGFGALNLHLNHPDVFGTTVPLSISVRTDAQYMTEEASGWDEQWGRLFGASGKIGEARLTDYYREQSPFYQLPEFAGNKAAALNIYIVNGDEENTLCRSNEELHILMNSCKIPHEYRVTDGCHSFNVWQAAIPNGLRFMSDAFLGNPYRGDLNKNQKINELPENQWMEVAIQHENISVFIPAEYLVSDRKYPALYLKGEFTPEEKHSIAATVNQQIEQNSVCPMIVVFIPQELPDEFEDFISVMEQNVRIRPGYRFRAMAGYQQEAKEALLISTSQVQFSACYLVDGHLSKEDAKHLVPKIKEKMPERTKIIISAPDKSNFYEGNGYIHILLREGERPHEYRVTEGEGGFEWMLRSLPEALTLISAKFHN